MAMMPRDRLDALFGELEELSGQRNAIDGRIVQIAAELDRDDLWGMTGARSVKALVGWKLGMAEASAKSVAAIADRFEELPRCTAEMAEGRLSLDQVGLIAQHAGRGSDEHYAALAWVATVSQLRKAISLDPRPKPPTAAPQRSLTKITGDGFSTYRITLPSIEAAKFDAALQSHHEARISERKREHGPDDNDRERHVPGCGATRGLHAHHIRHRDDGGPTDLDNLVLVCPYHHRLHHRGQITIPGPADQLSVTDADGEPLNPGSLARPPTKTAPDVAPRHGPLGERADWRWYDPFEPQPPPPN